MKGLALPLITRSGVTRSGVTLVELLVAIAIVGFLAGVVGVAARHAPEPSAADRLVAALAHTRRTAIREGRAVSVEVRIEGDLDGEPHAVTALPDGQVIADATLRTKLGLDRLTGVTRATTVTRTTASDDR